MRHVLAVPDMSCHSCVASVSQAVQAVPGVEDVRVDLARGTVTLTAPDAVATDTLAAAITAVGYRVTATEAVAGLLEDHETIVRNLRRACDLVESDVGTTDMFTAMLRGHEKMAWMLRATLQGEALRTNGRTPMRAAPPLA